MQVVCFDTVVRASDGDAFLNPAGWEFPHWEGQENGLSKSAVQGSAISDS